MHWLMKNLFGLRLKPVLLTSYLVSCEFFESTLMPGQTTSVRPPGNDKRRKVSNLTCFTLWKCPEHNGSSLYDKCYSQSDLSQHNAPLLDSLSRASVTCALGSEQTSSLDGKHFHSTCGPSNQTGSVSVQKHMKVRIMLIEYWIWTPSPIHSLEGLWSAGQGEEQRFSLVS